MIPPKGLDAFRFYFRHFYRILLLLLYCTVLYCTLLIMYHNPMRHKYFPSFVLIFTLIKPMYYVPLPIPFFISYSLQCVCVLPSAVRAFIFLARRIQPFLSLVDREVEFCVLTIY